MDDELPDDPLDEPIRTAAREYHAPPEPPREAMWRAIEAQRRLDRARRPALRRWTPWALAAAAVLTLGIGLGRWTAPGVEPEPPTAAPLATTAPGPRVNGTAYRLATVEHLGQSEAFLTLFRSSLASGSPERPGSASARRLLATNRMLLDSPAARDRRMRVLLEDLELVLAEIAQLTAGGSADDRELIRQAMERGGMLTRLRTVVPAGTVSTRGDL